jgi:hypothetical protein
MNQGDQPEIDEGWIALWVAQGLAQLADYLVKYDAYVAYCTAHGLRP